MIKLGDAHKNKPDEKINYFKQALMIYEKLDDIGPIKEAVRKTIKLAKKCKKTHDELKVGFSSSDPNTYQLLFELYNLNYNLIIKLYQHM